MRPVVAVDLGGTNIRAAFYPNGEPPATSNASRRTQAADGAQAVLDHINEAVETLKIPPEARTMMAIAIGAPGPLDRERGVVVHAPNLPGWLNLPARSCTSDGVARCLSKTTPIWRSASGVSAAGRAHIIVADARQDRRWIINDDRLVHAPGLAGGAGHILIQLTAVARAGNPVTEALASGRTARRFHELRAGAVRPGCGATTEEIVTAAGAGDAVAPVLGDAAWALGTAGRPVHTFNPERIILGGGMARAGGSFLETIETVLRSALMDPAFAVGLQVLPSALGDEAALLGGLALVEHEESGQWSVVGGQS
jgi:glucokinase